MARIIIVGQKEVDLDQPNSVRLWDSLSWLQKYEPDTPENLEKMKLLRDELKRRAYTINYSHKYTKMFAPCAQPQFPFSHAAKCILKQGHSGEHYSSDRPGKLIYWA